MWNQSDVDQYYRDHPELKRGEIMPAHDRRANRLPVSPAKGKAMKMQAQKIKVSEADWQATVIELAELYGWTVHAERHARTKDGRWMTPIQGKPGYPDLTMARGRDGKREILFLELKSESGKTTPEQREWLDLLGGLLFRPSDYESVERILR